MHWDEKRMAVGTWSENNYGEWSQTYQIQKGLYSDAQTCTITYSPDDILLPEVSVVIDSEIQQWMKLATAVAIVGVAVGGPVVVGGVGMIVETLSQLGSVTSTVPVMIHF